MRHLERLPAESRRLRFGAPFGDEMIARYVDGIDFHRDRVFGVYSLDRRLIGMAHLALDPTQWFAEIGLSVEPAHRDRGYGHALLQHAIRHAASAGYRTLFMQCLAENEIIKHIAQKSGLEVVTAHGEANAHIALSQEADGVQSANALDGPPVLIDSVFKRPLASQQILHTASESS
ncbi:MAG TPA: GNAT family N-acetyltransferase [Casimicrobiaceae bacterium]|nr:GNAT family N-acetyltransferase [Casimicrobiaceae bacterium]